MGLEVRKLATLDAAGLEVRKLDSLEVWVEGEIRLESGSLLDEGLDVDRKPW